MARVRLRGDDGIPKILRWDLDVMTRGNGAREVFSQGPRHGGRTRARNGRRGYFVGKKATG